jgi:hypothetical protein
MPFFATMRARSKVTLIPFTKPIIGTQIYFSRPAATAEFEKAGKSLLAHKCAEHLLPPSCLIDFGNSGLNAGIKWRPDPAELPEFGPEFKEVWDAYFANAPDKPVLWMGIIAACVFHTRSPD